MSTKGKWISILIIFGLLVSVYLTLKAHNPSTVVCSIGGSCEAVLSSKYATMFGLPVSAWGLAWYVVGFFLVYLTFSRHRYPWLYFLIWSGVGLLFSLYLLSLEVFKIHAYCTWCLSSLAATILIFVLALAARKELT